jgi:hypothetical protein
VKNEMKSTPIVVSSQQSLEKASLPIRMHRTSMLVIPPVVERQTWRHSNSLDQSDA